MRCRSFFRIGFVLGFLGLTCGSRLPGQVDSGPRAPVEKRADDLLGRMTQEEKIALIGGANFMHTRGIPRLGLPSLRMTDGPFGVRARETGEGEEKSTTVYASGLGLAASWDVDLAKQVGTSFGRDARARGSHILLAPGMNLYRVPICGRNFEYLGEDPLLDGRMASAFIQGVQGQGVAATMKHFAGNEQEYDRNNIDSVIDERTLRELYLKPFEIATKTSGAWCLMDSYNPLNGVHATASDFLNNQVLKKEWGFEGLVMSDWWATHDALGAANGGLDLEMPGPPAFFTKDRLLPLLAEGKVSPATLDDKVRRILRVMVAMGFLDRPQLDPSIPLDDPASAKVALQGAREGVVLLKNDVHLLPLDATKVKTIAVLGHNADHAVAAGGGSGHANYFHAVSVLQGIRDVAGPGVKVIRVPWTPLPDSTNFAVAPSKREQSFAAHAYGTGNNPPIPPDYVEQVKNADVAVVCVGYNDNVSNAWPTMRARPDAESEDIDRTYELPPGQERVVAAVAELNPHTIVILNAGGSVATAHWIGDVHTLLDAFYPGQEGGTALGEILFGKTTPSGKIAFTWEKKLEDTMAYGNFPLGSNRANTYKEGVFLGYRGFDSKGIEPLFPFGFGLSYTTFAYSNLQVASAANGDLTATFTLRNTGTVAGDEVAELYIAPPPGELPRPVHELKGFTRVSLEPGEAKTIRIPFARADLAYWNSNTKAWTVTPGDYTAQVGGSSRDLPLQANFKE